MCFLMSQKKDCTNDQMDDGQQGDLSVKKESPQYNPGRVEQEIIDFWKANNTFEKSITTKSEDNPYRFYD